MACQYSTKQRNGRGVEHKSGGLLTEQEQILWKVAPMLEGSDEKPQRKTKSHGESRNHPHSESKVVSHEEQEVHVWVHAQRHTIAPETFRKAPLFI